MTNAFTFSLSVFFRGHLELGVTLLMDSVISLLSSLDLVGEGGELKGAL